MTDETQLSIPDDLKSLTTVDDSVFDSVSGKGFLPRLQLMTAASDLCKKKKFPSDHFGLFLGQDPTDLGEEVDVLILAWRPKAVDFGGETPLTTFDPKDQLFADIQHRADNVQNSGCMYGHEFLVWLIDQQQYATLFLGTKSSRREARAVRSRLFKTATLTSQVIEGKKFTWTSIQCGDCITQHAIPQDESFKTAMVEQVRTFKSPPAQEVEIADSGDESPDRER